jgi:hypothetical protein
MAKNLTYTKEKAYILQQLLPVESNKNPFSALTEVHPYEGIIKGLENDFKRNKQEIEMLFKHLKDEKYIDEMEPLVKIGFKGISYAKSRGNIFAEFGYFLKSDAGYGNLKWILGIVGSLFGGFGLGLLSYYITHPKC